MTTQRPQHPLPDYEHRGDAIYAESFATIRAEANLAQFAPDVAQVVVRMIHACGQVDLADLVVASPNVVAAARTALATGAPIFTDAHMVAEGVTAHRLPAQNPVRCTLRDPRTPDLAAQIRTTRSAAAVDLWLPELDGAVVAIGNAPTALFRLLELLQDGAPAPAAIIGVPVGFVGAAESKAELISAARLWGIEFLTVTGRRGGSAMASAALNAVATAAEIIPVDNRGLPAAKQH